MFVVTWLPKAGPTLTAGPFTEERLAEEFMALVPCRAGMATVYEIADHAPMWPEGRAQDGAGVTETGTVRDYRQGPVSGSTGDAKGPQIAAEPSRPAPTPVAERFVAALGLARRGGTR